MKAIEYDFHPNQPVHCLLVACGWGWGHPGRNRSHQDRNVSSWQKQDGWLFLPFLFKCNRAVGFPLIYYTSVYRSCYITGHGLFILYGVPAFPFTIMRLHFLCETACLMTNGKTVMTCYFLHEISVEMEVILRNNNDTEVINRVETCAHAIFLFSFIHTQTEKAQMVMFGLSCGAKHFCALMKNYRMLVVRRALSLIDEGGNSFHSWPDPSDFLQYTHTHKALRSCWISQTKQDCGMLKWSVWECGGSIHCMCLTCAQADAPLHMARVCSSVKDAWLARFVFTCHVCMRYPSWRPLWGTRFWPDWLHPKSRTVTVRTAFDVPHGHLYSTY